jgi:hypothetical protein
MAVVKQTASAPWHSSTYLNWCASIPFSAHHIILKASNRQLLMKDFSEFAASMTAKMDLVKVKPVLLYFFKKIPLVSVCN